MFVAYPIGLRIALNLLCFIIIFAFMFQHIRELEGAGYGWVVPHGYSATHEATMLFVKKNYEDFSEEQKNRVDATKYAAQYNLPNGNDLYIVGKLYL